MIILILFITTSLFALQSPDISSYFINHNNQSATLNGQQWIQPASLTKVLLAIEIEKEFDTDHTFFTSGFALREDSRSPTQSTIFFYHFNPLLSEKKLIELAKQFKHNHPDYQRHPIVISSPRIEQMNAGIFAKEKIECYSAHPTGQSINFNCSPRTLTVGQNQTIKINGISYTTRNYSLKSCPFQTNYTPEAFLNKNKIKMWHFEDSHELIICAAPDTKRNIKIKIQDPQYNIQQAMQNIFPKQNIKLINNPQQPKKYSMEVTFTSNLSNVIEKMLARSNNFLAQWLFNQLDHPISRYIQDGSGLSRYNWISISELGQQFKTLVDEHPHLFSLMPTEDNNLIKRFGLKLPEHITLRVKSGTLSHIKNLAGTILKDGQPMTTFAISCTHPEAIDQACNKDIAKALAPYINGA